jgi:hypothetical protein
LYLSRVYQVLKGKKMIVQKNIYIYKKKIYIYKKYILKKK